MTWTGKTIPVDEDVPFEPDPEPTPEEEAEMERYKKCQAIMWMAFYDACPPEVRARWAETGRF